MADRSREFLSKTTSGISLKRDEAYELGVLLGNGQIEQAAASGILVAMSMKGESIEEIAGMRDAFLEMMITFPEGGRDAIDTCGTGGDGLHTVNISTAVALVLAGMGIPVIKHGNRSASSSCGSADVLRALKVPVEADQKDWENLYKKTNFAFLYAPKYHPAMANVAPVRRALGIRTIFNFLGPLLNPARVKKQVIGLSDFKKVDAIAQVLQHGGSQRVILMKSNDGADEATLSSATVIMEVTPKNIERYEITASDAGLDSAPLSSIKGESPDENAKILDDLFSGKSDGPIADTIALNGALGLRVCGIEENLKKGADLIKDAISSGKAKTLLKNITMYA